MFKEYERKIEIFAGDKSAKKKVIYIQGSQNTEKEYFQDADKVNFGEKGDVIIRKV